MPRNPLERSHAHADKAHNDLGRIIARLGTKRNPRGKVLTAYARARRDIARLLRSGAGRYEVEAALQGLQAEVRVAVINALWDGWHVGSLSARHQLSAYGVTPPEEARDYEYIALASDAVMETYQAQHGQIIALLAAGVGAALIVGDQRRQGALRPAPVIRTAADWSMRSHAAAFVQTVEAVPDAPYFQRQAIAAVDSRTTDCCLRVNGQIVELDEPFHLTGTPRYADHMMNPPFHNFCRTSPALYQADYDNRLTERMQNASREELGRRLDEKRKEAA